MRLMIKAGFVPDRLRLQAAENSASGDPVGRWFSANLDLKTVLAVAGFAGSLVGMHISASNRIAALEEGQQHTAAAISRIDTSQQQLYGLLVQYGSCREQMRLHE